MRALWAFLVAACLPTAGMAGTDVRLAGFGTFADGRLTTDIDGFRALAADLGFLLASRVTGPAHTTGPLGFDIGLETTVGNIDEGASRWQKALDEPPSALVTVGLAVRKGLPYGLELGGHALQIAGSSQWGLGMDLRYAFVEGFRWVPDIALRAGIGTLVGSRDLSLLATDSELTLSKDFGIGGAVALTPYVSGGVLFVRATSYVVGLFPEDAADPVKFVFPPQNLVRGTGAFGLLVTAVHVRVGFETRLGASYQGFTFRLAGVF